jgi:hypothetical protein
MSSRTTVPLNAAGLAGRRTMIRVSYGPDAFTARSPPEASE